MPNTRRNLVAGIVMAVGPPPRQAAIQPLNIRIPMKPTRILNRVTLFVAACAVALQISPGLAVGHPAGRRGTKRTTVAASRLYLPSGSLIGRTWKAWSVATLAVARLPGRSLTTRRRPPSTRSRPCTASTAEPTN